MPGGTGVGVGRGLHRAAAHEFLAGSGHRLHPRAVVSAPRRVGSCWRGRGGSRRRAAVAGAGAPRVSSAAARTRGLFGEGRAVCDLVRRPLAVRAAGDMAGRHADPRSSRRSRLRRLHPPSRPIGKGDVPALAWRAMRWSRPIAGRQRARRARDGARRGPMSRNTNFYYSFLVLTPAKRRAIIAVWDFCRAIDDTVDERAVDSEPQRVEALEAARRVAEGDRRPCSRPASRRRRRRAARCSRSRACSACRAGRSRISSTASAWTSATAAIARSTSCIRYCYKVASTVGLICVEIFGCREAASRDYAVDLGIALQLTNILRDVKTDLDRGRLYIPLDDLARFNCTEDMIRGDSRNEAVTALAAASGRARPRVLSARRARIAARRCAKAGGGGDHERDLPGDPRRDRAARLRRVQRGRAHSGLAAVVDSRSAPGCAS